MKYSGHMTTPVPRLWLDLSREEPSEEDGPNFNQEKEKEKVVEEGFDRTEKARQKEKEEKEKDTTVKKTRTPVTLAKEKERKERKAKRVNPKTERLKEKAKVKAFK
jgi:hypothetical protein